MPFKKIITIFFFLYTSLISAQTILMNEHINNQTYVNTWKISPSKNGFIINGSTNFESVTIHTDSDYNTIKWKLIRPQDNVNITASRTKNIITIKGVHYNQSINKALEIDSTAWIQLPGLQLSTFIKSTKDSTTRWILSWDKLDKNMMKFNKVTTHKALIINNNSLKSTEVLMKPTGYKGLFWSANLWFDPTTGLYQKYSGPRGGLKSPKTLVELRKIIHN